MYPAAVNSQSTVTMGALDISTTQVTVLDASVLPDAPNLLVLGTDQTAETVLMTAKEGNVLTIERAFQGTAKSWPTGTEIARNMTAYDMDTLKENMEDTASALSAHTADKENPHETAGDQLTSPVPISLGGTGAMTAAEALSSLGTIPIRKNFASIGLENGSETIKNISESLPNSSMLIDSIGESNNTEIYPKPRGLLFVIKVDIYRIGFIFFSKTGSKQIYYGVYHNENGWSGWIELADASKTLPIADNAGFHNSIYRGKALGSAVTDEQWAAIAAGTFTDLYIGDYWTIGGVNYRIAAFDYYLRSGDTDMTTHHVTLVPDASLYNHVMNDTNTTDGAYIGSKMYAEGLTQAKTTINNAFGAAHILTHRRHMQNAVTNGYSTGGTWYDSNVELMTEQNVYGGRIYGNVINGTGWPNLYTNDKSQYPLFAMRPDMISNRQAYWLRDVANASFFCNVGSSGNAGAYYASTSYGVRPAFSIKS